MLAKILSCFKSEVSRGAAGLGEATTSAVLTDRASGVAESLLLSSTAQHHQDCRVAEDIANAFPSALFSSTSLSPNLVHPNDFVARTQRHLFPVFVQEHALTVSRVSRAVRRLPGYAQVLYRLSASTKCTQFTPHPMRALMSAMLLPGTYMQCNKLIKAQKASGMTAEEIESSLIGARQNLTEEVVASMLSNTPMTRRLRIQLRRKTRGATRFAAGRQQRGIARQRRKTAAAQWRSVYSRRPFRWANKATPQSSSTKGGPARSISTSTADKRKVQMRTVHCSALASQGGVVYAKSAEYQCRVTNSCPDIKSFAEMFDPHAREADREQYDLLVPSNRDFVIKCVESSTFCSSAYHQRWRQRLSCDVPGRERQHLRLRFWRETVMIHIIAYLEAKYVEQMLLASRDAEPLFISLHHFLPAMEHHGALWDVIPMARWRQAYTPSPRTLHQQCTPEEIGRVMMSPLTSYETLASERAYFPPTSERSATTLSELLGKPAQDVYRTWASPILCFSHIAQDNTTAEPQTSESRNTLLQSCLSSHGDLYRDLLQIHSLRVADNYITPESIDYTPHLEIIRKHFDDKRLRQTDVEPSRRIESGGGKRSSFIAALRSRGAERLAAPSSERTAVGEVKSETTPQPDDEMGSHSSDNKASTHHTECDEVVLGDSDEYALLLHKLRRKHPHPTRSASALGATLRHLQQSPRVLFIKKHFAATHGKLRAAGIADDMHSLHRRTAQLLSEEYSATAVIGKPRHQDAVAPNSDDAAFWANDPLLSALSQQANLLLESRDDTTARIASFEERLGQLKMSL